MAQQVLEPATDEWVAFPGSELEGKRPKALCPTGREALTLAANGGRGASGARQKPALPGRQQGGLAVADAAQPAVGIDRKICGPRCTPSRTTRFTP